MRITILIPVYNEEETLPHLIERLEEVTAPIKGYEWEFLFVNDGSKDNSLKYLKAARKKDGRFRYIDLSRNFGKEVAMMAGFDYVRGDCVIVMDGDLQHPPEIIPDMIRYWEEGYEDVYARRTSRETDGFIYRQFAKVFRRGINKLSEIGIEDDSGDFRLLDKRCLDALRRMREVERYTKGMYCWIGFKKKAIDYEPGARYAGKTKWSPLKLIGLAIDGITSFSIAPLRFATVMGVIISIFAFFYMFVIIVKTLVFGEPQQGFPTIMVTMLFLGGVQLMSLGIIGEYIGTIFKETKKRPPYVIREIDEDE